MSVVSSAPAAVRLPRSVAARRGLLTLLLLGGFLTLAFLFGGTAQAASGSDHSGKAASEQAPALLGEGESASGSGFSEAGLEERRTDAQRAFPGLRPGDAPRHVVSDVIEPVTRIAGNAGHVTGPVGDTVDGVSDAVGLGGLSEQLGLRPGDCDEAPSESGSDPAPDHGEAEPSAPEGAGDPAAHSPGRDGPRGADSGRELVFHGAAANTTADGGTSYGDGGVPERLPFHQAPVAPATASTSSQYASDGNGSRGGPLKSDGWYVSGVEHFGPLQPGAVRAAEGTPTRDRAAEVLEFPG